MSFAVAYALALVTGTAIFIAALGSHESRETRPTAQQLTAAEQVLQRAADSGVQAPGAFLLASRNIPNDKRGL